MREVTTDFLLGSNIQPPFHRYTLLVPVPSSISPPCTESLPSFSFELHQLPEDRRKDGEAGFGGWGDGGADGGWRRGCEEQCSQNVNTHSCAPRLIYMNTRAHTHTHIGTPALKPPYPLAHAPAVTHICCQSIHPKPPAEAPLWFNWCNYICIRLSCFG